MMKVAVEESREEWNETRKGAIKVEDWDGDRAAYILDLIRNNKIFMSVVVQL